jgi:hypothetical protein
VVAQFMERLAVSKQAAQKFDEESFLSQVFNFALGMPLGGFT